MNLKRFILTIAAICMVFGMSITAFAETEEPAAVAESSIVQTDATNTSVTVSWGASQGATAYRVYKNGVMVKETSDTEVTMKVSQGSSSLIKIVAVAYDENGNALLSDGAELDNVWALPYAPKNVAKFSKGTLTWLPTKSNKVTVGWVNTSKMEYEPAGYQIVIYNMKGKRLKTYYSTVEQVKFNLSKVKNTGFKVKVRAYIKINGKKVYGTWSSTRTVVPQAKISLKKTATDGNTATVKVSWKKVKNATKYMVYVCSDTSTDATKWKKVATVSSSRTYMYIANCKAGKKVGVYVVPVVKYGKKKYKAEFSWYLHMQIS